MYKQFIIAYFICIIPFLLNAQDITGFWKGSFNMNSACFLTNNIELQITVKGDSIYGSSYHYLDIDNYVKKHFTGSYQSDTKKLTVAEDLVTTYKIPAYCKICIKKYNLVYNRTANQEFLTGDWNSVLGIGFIDCGIGQIKLSRIKESAFREIPEINVDTGLIRLDFYDNAEIDGDSISVVVNGKTVLTHQRLTDKPITMFVRMDFNSTFQEVEMVAENMGTIPPNTALLIITAGKKRYELFLSATDKKSAKVRFLYEKGKM